MKIGVNARLLTKPYTGVGQYTLNLFKELTEIDSENEYILVVPEVVPEKVDFKFGDNVEIKVLPEKRLPTAGLRKTWWEQVLLMDFFEKENIDMAWFTYPCNFWAKDWYKKGVKTVVTVHDCIPWTDKRYRRGVLSKMYHSQTRRAVKRADLVFTVSGTSKDEIERVCKVPEEKIEVIYNDAGKIYKQPVDGRFADEVLERFSLKKNGFLLYVGGYDARKNVDELVKDVKGYGKYPLVLVGGKLFKNKLYASFDEDDGEIVKTGFLEERTLSALYSRCFAFVHLSKQEGFNIPLLEAANCGAPLVLSNIPVHREVAEDAAVFVCDNFGEALEKVAERRADYALKSHALAKRYSWKKYAKIVRESLDMLSS